MFHKLLFLILCCITFSLHASPNFAEHIHFNPNGPNKVGYLHIEKDRAIDQSTYLYVKFALEAYKKQGVSFIILHLDTPGGEVFPAMKIADLLHKIDNEDQIPVVAFIDNWAISAGAMLAYACRYIGIVPSSSMGAAEPVTSGPDGNMQSASEKVNSALRAEFANLANYYGRNPLIAEAMVDKEMILVMRDGKIIQLQEESQIRKNGKGADLVISRQGKLLTLNASQLTTLGIADFEVTPGPLPSLGPQTSGMSSLVFQEPFFASIPQVTILTFYDWKIDFFAFLSHPLISSLLFMGLIIGIYLEMSHPGFGAPGIIALVCLGLILLSSFSIHTVQWLELILFAAGIILLLVEGFVLPGFGIAGILGIVLTLFGLIALMLPSLDGVKFTWDMSQINLATLDFIEQFAYLCGAFVASVVLMAILGRWVTPRLLRVSRLVLTETQEGYVGVEFDSSVIGKIAVVLTELKPAGHISVDGKQYQALSETGFVSKGAEVIIVGGRGSHLIVREKKT